MCLIKFAPPFNYFPQRKDNQMIQVPSFQNPGQNPCPSIKEPFKHPSSIMPTSARSIPWKKRTSLVKWERAWWYQRYQWRILWGCVSSVRAPKWDGVRLKAEPKPVIRRIWNFDPSSSASISVCLSGLVYLCNVFFPVSLHSYLFMALHGINGRLLPKLVKPKQTPLFTALLAKQEGWGIQ